MRRAERCGFVARKEVRAVPPLSRAFCFFYHDKLFLIFHRQHDHSPFTLLADSDLLSWYTWPWP